MFLHVTVKGPQYVCIGGSSVQTPTVFWNASHTLQNPTPRDGDVYLRSTEPSQERLIETCTTPRSELGHVEETSAVSVRRASLASPGRQTYGSRKKPVISAKSKKSCLVRSSVRTVSLTHAPSFFTAWPAARPYKVVCDSALHFCDASRTVTCPMVMQFRTRTRVRQIL